jgi:RNA polymerase sigma-70 factor (ECF subfamily)
MVVPWGSEASSDSLSAAGLEALTAAPESGIQLVVASAAQSMDFAELYRTQFPYVWKTARRLGVSAADVDDVVQETFLTVHRLLDTYVATGSIQSWLFAVLFRVVQRHRRSQRRRTALTDDGLNVDAFAGSSARAPDKNAENLQTVRILEEILDTLDPDRRAVLVLADLEEKPTNEIAEILGINVNTASSRLRAAREHVEAGMARHRARDGWRLK